MKNNFIIVLFLILAAQAFGHDMRYDNIIPRTWEFKSKNKIQGTFYLYRDGKVFIETPNQQLVNYPFESLSKTDQQFVLKKEARITQINQQFSPAKNNAFPANKPLDKKPLFAAVLLAIFGFILFRITPKNKLKYIFPVLGIGLLTLVYSFTARVFKRAATTTSPYFVDSAFTPFKPDVYTRWDGTYFYVESRGVPRHNMMVGITSWQQQVPVPQCYTGNNPWSIPLNPVNATTPVPVNNKHFLRGAVAVAANGIAIFNPYTNTGVDAFADGQLDSWGGHSGRADDYHYHTAPLFLEKASGPTTPIAFALDGYAVYGSREPDGSAMKTLDANHGHVGTNGVYHYHGTKASPYMIGNMVGKVTEDTTLQIIPQASAKPIRPSLTPLKGAVITGFHANGSNSYSLIYTLSGATDSVVYSWTNAGSYTYKFYIQGQAMTSNTYNGFAQCTVPVSIKNVRINPNAVNIFPNPTRDKISIQLNNGIGVNAVKEINIFNYSGNLVYQTKNYQNSLDMRNFPKGIYLIKMKISDTEITKKIVLQ